ncbi:MAG: hypothetical protein R3F17_03420 [Planctomycetota bacterium]
MTWDAHQRPAALAAYLADPDLLATLSYSAQLVYDLEVFNSQTTAQPLQVSCEAPTEIFIAGGLTTVPDYAWQFGNPAVQTLPVASMVVAPQQTGHLTGVLDLPGAFQDMPVHPSNAGLVIADGFHSGTFAAWPSRIDQWYTYWSGPISNASVIQRHSTATTTYELPWIGAQSDCTPAQANSTGQLGTLQAFGVPQGDGYVVLDASNLPAGVWGYFLFSTELDTVTAAPLGMGRLCLGGNIHRWHDTLAQSTAGGTLQHGFTPDEIPYVAVPAGTSLHFQLWHRDTVAGVPTANATGSVQVTFQ